MASFSKCEDFVPNDVVEYIDADTKELLHIGLFFNPQFPPGYHSHRVTDKGEFIG